jgi:hypothetical protein
MLNTYFKNNFIHKADINIYGDLILEQVIASIMSLNFIIMLTQHQPKLGFIRLEALKQNNIFSSSTTQRNFSHFLESFQATSDGSKSNMVL